MKDENIKIFSKTLIISIIVFFVIDVILVAFFMFEKQKEGDKSKTTSITAENTQNVEFQGYSFDISSNYKVRIEGNLLIVSISDDENYIFTINEGTMDNIKNNLGLLENPINDQGATITKEASLENWKDKEIVNLEYTLEDKNLIIAYTNIDDDHILDVLAESKYKENALDLLVRLSNVSKEK